MPAGLGACAGWLDGPAVHCSLLEARRCCGLTPCFAPAAYVDASAGLRTVDARDVSVVPRGAGRGAPGVCGWAGKGQARQVGWAVAAERVPLHAVALAARMQRE